MYIFAFAHTYKDKNYAASSGELTPKEIRNVKMDINYIDVELDEEVLDNISLIAVPLCDNADIFIIDSLLNKYTTNGRLERSSLSGSIKE